MSKKKRKMPTYAIIIIVLSVLFVGWIAIGYFSSRVEQLEYTVLDSSKEYEIREIGEHLIIETEVRGGFESGGNEAFDILAGYIFGNNKKKEKIAMTTPVVAEDSVDGFINFSFFLPAKYTMDTLPEPVDSRVKIRKVDKKKVAVLRFTGFYDDEKFNKKREELEEYLKRDGLNYSNISSAGYNPPWTPPFMRRLEVWADID